MRRYLIALLVLAAAAASGGLGTVTLSGQSLVPVARSAVVTTQEGVAKSGMLPAFDPEGDPFTFSVVTPPTKGTLTITNAATGAFTFTPTAGVTGYDTFVYRAADATGGANATGFVYIVTATPTWPGQTARASVATGGVQQTVPSGTLGQMLSADGRFIAFSSGVIDESAGIFDLNVHVHDRQTGITTLVSADTNGVPIGGALPWISPDGTYVTFTSLSSALPGGHPSGDLDVYLKNRTTGYIERVSVSTSGEAGNGGSALATLSADARYVVFTSPATNLAPGDTDDDEDIFVRDRLAGTTTLVSVSSAGVKGNSDSWFPSISADGRFVSFNSEASNLVPNDTNGEIDLFVRDLQTGQTTRVSVATGGVQSNGNSQGTLNLEGRFVAFASDASNLVTGDTNGVVDVFVHDRQTGQTTRVSLSSSGAQGNGPSDTPMLSADGRYIIFHSEASNLVPGDTNGLRDEFVHDRVTGQTVRVNIASDGTQANGVSVGDEDGCCIYPSISADGRSLVVTTAASNLVPGDTNGLDDVFVIGPVSVGPTTIEVPGPGGTGTVNVSFDYPGTPWTATTATPWITIDAPAGGSANGTVTFTAAPNTGAAARTGTLAVALQTITVTQPAVTTPQPPTGLFASSVVGNTLTLRFTPPVTGPAPTGFIVDGGVNPGETLASIPTGTTAPILTIEVPDGAFYVRVRTATAAGTSGPSNEIRVFVHVSEAPSAPTNLLATVSGSSVALAWRNTSGGGEPTSMVLDVSGSFTGSLPIPLGESGSFGDVPPGTYTLALRAVNGTGSSPASNAVTISVPSACSGPPLPPANFVVITTGNGLRLFWDPADSGPAPTEFVITVTGAFNGAVPVTARTISATVAPGSYNLSVQARNACGPSAATAVRTVTVP